MNMISTFQGPFESFASLGSLGTIALILVLGGALLVGLVARARRIARSGSNTSKPNGDSPSSKPGPLVEAKKNTLRSELHDLNLGIKQVQGYINALKGEEDTVVAARKSAQEELDKASQLKSDIEAVLDNATTDAQVDGFALGLEQARLHVRKARAISKAESAEDDEDEDQ